MEEINNLKLYELYYLVSVDALYDEDIVPYDMNLIWQKIKDYYHQANGNGDVNHNVLYEWLQNKTRYELLDELMLHVYNRLINKENNIDNTDLFFVNNIIPIWGIMKTYQSKIEPLMYEENNVSISPISKNETIGIVKAILTEIDPDKEWLKIYEEAIQNHRIIYLDELDEEAKEALINKLGIKSLKDINNSCMFLNNGEIYIFLNYTHTITDVPNTIHEVVHYIIKTINKDNCEVPILREYPSIFFESYALNYLIHLGYNEREIRTVNRSRITDTFRVFDDLKDIMYYLMLIMEKGHINATNDKKKYNNELKQLKKNLSKEDILAITTEDPDFFAANLKCPLRCDKVSYDLMLNPYILSNYYPYIIGTYLSDKTMSRLSNSNHILSMVKYIAEKITVLDAYDVFCTLDCHPKEIVPTNYPVNNFKNKCRVKSKK